MDQHLNILVQSSDYYAPFAGVMLTSLFENNRDIDYITVYLMTSDMSERNMERYRLLAQQYGRTIKTIDASKIDRLLEEKHIPKYSGSYAPYYKIFALSFIEDDLDRLIYLDSDMIVCGSLSKLATVDIGEKNAIGMCLDQMSDRYRKYINGKHADYYNTGMVVIQVKVWTAQKCAEKVISYLANTPPGRGLYADQDVLNPVLAGHIATLPLIYNLPTGTLLFSDYHRFKSAFGVKRYYSAEEYDEAQKNPVIWHFIGLFNPKPWTVHIDFPEQSIETWPTKELWRKYLAQSLWSDFVPSAKKLTPLGKAEYICFRTMPYTLYAFLRRTVSDIYTWLQVVKLQRKQKA